MLFKRNPQCNRPGGAMKGFDRWFAVVGAAHLVGPDSIPATSGGVAMVRRLMTVARPAAPAGQPREIRPTAGRPSASSRRCWRRLSHATGAEVEQDAATGASERGEHRAVAEVLGHEAESNALLVTPRLKAPLNSPAGGRAALRWRGDEARVRRRVADPLRRAEPRAGWGGRARCARGRQKIDSPRVEQRRRDHAPTSECIG
jgi:hypothetical protein